MHTPSHLLALSGREGITINIWGHASGEIFELLVSAVIFILLWKRRSFYTLPFLLVFPWSAFYNGMGGIFDTLGHTGDYHNIMIITGWSPLYFYAISLILTVVGVFFFVSLFPLLGLAPEDRKSLLVLPIGMLLFTVLGNTHCLFLVPGSPIDLQYHLAHKSSCRRITGLSLWGAIGILLALIYITLYRSLYREFLWVYARKVLVYLGEIFGTRVSCSSSVWCWVLWLSYDGANGWGKPCTTYPQSHQLSTTPFYKNTPSIPV